MSEDGRSVEGLRRVAWGPGTSATEREAALSDLRELEARSTATADQGTADPIAIRDQREPRRRIARAVAAPLVALALSGGALAGAQAADPLAEFPTPADAADRAAAESFRWPNAHARVLGETEGFEVVGYFGPSAVPDWIGADTAEPSYSVTWTGPPQICIGLRDAGGASTSTCTSEDQFTTLGLRTSRLVPSGDPETERRATWQWGPSGGLRTSAIEVPIRIDLDGLFSAAATADDHAGRPFVPAGEPAETARFVEDYNGIRIWVYRQRESLCMVAASPDHFAEVLSECILEEDFDGIELAWPPQDVTLKLDERLRLSVTRS